MGGGGVGTGIAWRWGAGKVAVGWDGGGWWRMGEGRIRLDGKWGRFGAVWVAG